MSTLDLAAISRRYSRALDAKPSKGAITADGIAAITDSVCDIPQLLAEVAMLKRAARTLGKIVDDTIRDVIRATGPDDLIDETGDGDFALVFERLAELGVRAETAEARVRAAEQSVRRARALVADWQANSGSRPLDDTAAEVWSTAARQLLDALEDR